MSTPSLFTDIAEQIGTPCYVYDHARITRNFRRLASAFQGSEIGGQGSVLMPALCYSVKANSNLSILKALRELGAGFDVVSVGEMKRALLIGANPASIVFAGVGKRDDELIAALDAQIGWINVESAQELRILSDLAAARHVIQRVALRINPAIDPHTHRYLATGKGTSKFGIEAAEALQLVARRADYPGVAINGIHIHIGSMVNEAEPYVDALRVALDVIAQCRALGATITTLDLGGGFGIAYESNQQPQPAPIEAIAATILPMAIEASVQLLFEPGRSIIADAGVLLTRVLYTKTNGGVNYAVVDAAMNDLIRPALYGARHRVMRIDASREYFSILNSQFPISYSIVGPVCESGDILAEGVALPELRRGDLLLIHDAGAYGMSMASNYNSRPRAAEVWVEGAAWRMIRRRETIQDGWQHEVECLS